MKNRPTVSPTETLTFAAPQLFTSPRRGEVARGGADDARRVRGEPSRPVNRVIRNLLCTWVLLLAATPLAAKTLTLTDEDADRMAQIAEAAPRNSWAGSEVAAGIFYNAQVDLAAGRAFLVRFPIDDIPKGQTITKAELTFPVALASGEQKIQVRRVTAAWGPGVSWQFRTARPKKVEWATAGAKGAKDRVTKPTATAKVKSGEDATFNLTEDVELWYAGAAANEGWAFTVDDPDGFVRLTSPTWTGAGTWKLRITYEPK